MLRCTPLFALLLVGCDDFDLSQLTNLGNDDGKPPKIEGLYELHQVETASGEIAAVDAVTAGADGCLWGRMTWDFQGERLVVGQDLLCSGGTDQEHYGCSVSVTVEATWDDEQGRWMVPQAAGARSRTKPMDPAALQVPTECSVQVAAGSYPVARVRNQRWRWEMGRPDGTVLRLKVADNDRPDFVRALRLQEAAATPEPEEAPPEGEASDTPDEEQG